MCMYICFSAPAGLQLDNVTLPGQANRKASKDCGALECPGLLLGL